MNIPFLATYHGIYNARSALKRRYNAVMTQGPLTIANSNMTKDHIIAEHGLAAARIIVIPRGVDMALFDPDVAKPDDIITTRKTWGLSPSDRAVLLPGRLTAWKGQPVAIKALAALPPHVKLIILGDAQGREAYRDKLKALAAAQGVTSRLILAPHNQNMPLMLAASDIVLSTSVEPEAFGRVAIEAQAMCKPIIATAHGGTLETVLPEKTGLWVPPDDVDALSGAIQRCLNGTEFDPAFTRRHIAKNFSKQQLQEKTLGVYRQLIEK
jgi:glycosyltransferase involved in cell wall biosynthesis